MHHNIIYLIILNLFLTVLVSCTKEPVPTFIIPSTYRYNSPNFDSKQVYVIDTLKKTFRKLNDTLGTFNRGNKEIADSINKIIQREFLSRMIHSITFETSDKAKIVLGKLDTIGLKNNIIKTDSVFTKYTLSGNQVNLDAFPDFYININNSFEELNFCQEFTLRSIKIANHKSEKRYFKKFCTNTEPINVIKNIITSNPTVIYDTISLEYVNYIFSRY